jgi:hypothetical protein
VLGHTIEEQAQIEMTERGAWKPKLTVDGIENKLAATAFTADPAERFGYGLQLFLDGIRRQLALLPPPPNLPGSWTARGPRREPAGPVPARRAEYHRPFGLRVFDRTDGGITRTARPVPRHRPASPQPGGIDAVGHRVARPAMARLVTTSRASASRRLVAWASRPMVSGLTMKAP